MAPSRAENSSRTSLTLLFLIKCGMEHEIVVGDVPRYPQRVGRQNDETDGSTGQRLHFNSVGEGARWIADFQKSSPKPANILERFEMTAVALSSYI